MEPGASETVLPAAERRYLTVVFVDLVGYTHLSEQLDPEDLRILQRRYQNLALRVMERYGGFVARSIGDGILVYFGYPISRGSDAERAVRASLELAERLQELDTNLPGGKMPPLSARIGIHSGLVLITSEVISGGTLQHGAIGEAVNVAARIQAEAPTGAVVISQDTYDLIEGRFECTRLGSRSFKGLSREVAVFQVEKPITGGGRNKAGQARGATNLIGRDTTLDKIVAAWRSTILERRCSNIAVLGEAGIGKTRLVQELCGRPEFTDAVIIQANCHELFANTPFYPLAAYLWTRAELSIDDGPEDRAQKLATLLGELALDVPENRQLIASLFTFAVKDGAGLSAPTPLLFKRKQFDFVVALLRQVVSAHPTLLWIEDAHWLDASSAELLGEIVTALRDAPLLVLTTRRSFPRPSNLPAPDTIIEIEQLNKPECFEIAQSIPGAHVLGIDTLQRAVDASEGIPLFVEQFVISLIEDASRLRPQPAKTGRVPLILAEMMSERLDRRPSGRRIVQVAACIGRSFTPDFLAQVLSWQLPAVTEALRAMVEAEILLPRRYGAEMRYEFRHALLQRVAHESIVQSERREIHSLIVDAIQRLEKANQPPLEVLAHHLTEAGRFPEAIAAWLQAGASAARQSAHIEAIQQLKRGLELLDKVPDQRQRREFELRLQAALMGSIMATEGATSINVSQCCERGLELCQSGEPTPLVLPFAFGQFTFTNCRGRVQEAASLARLFLSLAERSKSDSGRVIGHRMLGTVLFGQGQAQEARTHFELSLGLYSRERDEATTHQFGQNTEVHTKSSLSLVLFCLGEIDAALEMGIGALRSADALRHPHSTAIPLTYVGGWVFGLCDASDHLLQEAKRLIDLAEQHQLGAFRAHGAGLLGWALCQRGHLEQGAAAMEEAVTALDAIHFRLALSGYLGNLADVQRRLGKLQAAAVTIARAIECMSESSFLWFEPELRRIEALITRELSPAGGPLAEGMLRDAATRAQALGFPVLERRCLLSLKQCIGSMRTEPKLDARLDALAPFGNIAQRVAAAMHIPQRALTA